METRNWWPWAIVIAVAIVLAGAGWLLGWLPWWGALIAVPVIAVLEVGAFIVWGVLSWMSSGSH